MADWEASLRLGSFFAVFILFALLEYRRPYRPVSRRRWWNNLGLSLLGTLLLRLVFPAAATGVALWAAAENVGLANRFALPLAVSVPLGMVLLDLLIYWQHRLFHRLLVSGVPVQYQKDGETRGDFVRLIDWADVKANEWLAINQFSVQGPKHTRRPDIILFVNGLPLVLV